MSAMEIIAARAMNRVAWLLLRACGPGDAHRMLCALGSVLPEKSVQELHAVARAIRGRGTCLTRAMTLSARCKDLDVVIAVEPRVSSPLFAHAWAAHAGGPLDPTEVAGAIIARLTR